MLRRDRQIRTQLHQLVDACLFAFSFWLAYAVRGNPHVVKWLRLDPEVLDFSNYAWLFLILIPAAPLVLEAQGFYQRPLVCPRRATAWPLFKACLFASLSLILGLFLFKSFIPRWVVIWFGFISFGLVFAKEEIIRWTRRSKVAQAQYRRRLLLAGTSEDTRRMRAELETKSPEEVEILAELDLEHAPVKRLVELLHEHSVNGVVLNAKHGQVENVEAAIRACELEGVEAWLVSDFFMTQISRTSFDDFYGWPVLVFRSTPGASWQRVIKHLVDFFGSLLLLLLAALPLALVAVLIKVTSPGPVLCRQRCSGLNGRPFTFYKLRTTVANADQLKDELAARNDPNGPEFKRGHEPRVTPLGKILRKFSIDELPQLYNVLRGEMSFVGPRPRPADEVDDINNAAQRRRLSMRPGLTCLRQVRSQPGASDINEWTHLDLAYIDHWSLWLDFKILWQTVPIVLTGARAR